jgi:mRNA interferase MazF
VQKWGNSLALRVPKAFAAEVGLRNESPVDVSVVNGKIIIASVAEPKLTLEQLLTQVTEDNLHHEVDTWPGRRKRNMVSSETYVPQRGEAVWITFNPQSGLERAGRRPAVVLSHGSYNGKVGLAILCPITNQIRGYPFEVLLPAGMAVTGAILSDQIKSLDWRARKAELICTLPIKIVSEALQKLGTLLSKE